MNLKKRKENNFKIINKPTELLRNLKSFKNSKKSEKNSFL